MKKKEELPIIEVPASGKRNWGGGAWCLVFVYSNKGNFLLKGYFQECQEYIKEQNYKCWAIFQLHHGKSHPYSKDKFRRIIKTYGVNFDIYGPSSIGKRKSHKDWKFTVWEKGNSKNKIYIKRLPKVFREFDLPGEKTVEVKKSILGEVTLGSLKNK
jgi:hypothetical protein